MTNTLRVFKLTVYAPRSVDPTESTPLTPAAGAPHSDPFVVTTIQGIAGAKPYLDIPTSRGAIIDPLTKKTTVSNLTARILDARVTAGGSNAARWVTAFTGDAQGGNQLLGRLVRIVESFDGGATFPSAYYTGRISSPATASKLWTSLSLTGLEDDLDQDIFVGDPATAVHGYARLAQIAPLGLMQPVRADGTTGYAGLPVVSPIRGTIQAIEASGGRRAFTIIVDQAYGGNTNDAGYRLSMTQALIAAGKAAMNKLATTQSVDPNVARNAPPQLMLATAATSHVASDFNAYDLVSIDVHEVGGLYPPPNPFAPIKLGSAPLGLTSPIATTLGFLTGSTIEGSAAPVPTAGESIDFYIIDPTAAPTETTPLLIDDVGPVQYLADLCAGSFGRLDKNGTPLRSIAFNANGVTDTGRLPWRNRITAASKLNTEIEAVCLAYHLGYYLDGAGAVTLVDLRRSAITGPAWGLTDDDLVTTAPLQWSPDRGSAVTTLFGTYYPEEALTASDLPKPHSSLASINDVPDVATVAMQDLPALSVLVPELGPRSGDFKQNALKIDAKGFRCRMAAQTLGLVDQERIAIIGASHISLSARSSFIQQYFIGYADEIAGPFGLGPAYVDVTCRIGSANVALVKLGTYGTLALTALPDPATNTKGGTRLGLCVSRTENAGQVTLRFLDAGENSVALSPTFGVPTNASGATTQAVALPVTLNALAEPVRVAFAATDPSVATRPADTDAAWIAVPVLVRSSGTVTISPLPGGQRIWLRARTVPGAGQGFKLPSAWVSPATDHIDLAGITAPSALAITGTTVDALTLSWTNGDPTKGVEVFLALGASVTATDANRLSRPLPAGTTTLALPALATSTQYTIGVRALDANGGTSTLTTLTFTSPASGTALTAPIDARGFSGRQNAVFGFPQQDGVYGLAVAATVFPGFVEFQEAVETSAGSGVYGTATTIAKTPSVQGEWTLFERVAPNDGLRRQLTARHVRDGATPSAWTDPVVVQPWSAQHLEQYAVVVQRTGILRIADTESSDGTLATMAVTVGDLVDHVQIFSRTVAIDAAGDPYDFSDLSVPATVLVKKPDAGTNGFSLSLPQPSRGFKLAGRMVPYYLSPAGEYLAGDSVPFTITAAPPALNAIIHATRTGASAALSVDVAFGVSDGPVGLDVIETVLGVDTTILSTTRASPATLDPSGYPALDGRPIPFGAESVSWRAVITDVSGQPWTFGPVTALPPLVSAAIQTSESGATGTVRATVTDAGSYLDPAGVDELDPSKIGAITWHVTRLGVTTVSLSTTAPGAGTSGVYTLDVALDPKHPVLVKGFRHYVDGSTDSLGSWTFDTDKIADVASIAAANDDANAVITANFDTDTAIGANCARYSLDGGTTWTTIAVTSDLVAQATIARTASKQTAIVQGLNAIDGAWGNTATVEIDAYVSEGPSLTAAYVRLTDTTGQIVWSCTKGIVTDAIDGGSPATPSASPIAITLDAETHSHEFVAVNGGQTQTVAVSVPALPASGGASGSYSALTNVLFSAATDQIDFGWAWSGPSAAHNVYVSDPGRYGDAAYHLFTTTAAGAVTLRYTAGEDITTNHGDPTVDIGFYVEAVVGSTIGVRSVPTVTTYNHV